MKLTQDCICETMLFLEENLKDGRPLMFPCIEIDNFSSEEVLEAAMYLCDDDCISAQPVRDHINTLMSVYITGITPKGHRFLESIRND